MYLLLNMSALQNQGLSIFFFSHSHENAFVCPFGSFNTQIADFPTLLYTSNSDNQQQRYMYRSS